MIKKRKWEQIDCSWLKDRMPEESRDMKSFVSNDDIKVLISIDHGRYHMSISKNDRIPSWNEIKSARERFLPIGKHFVMALPPPQHYINFHPHTMHLWELLPDRERDLIWTFEQG